MGKYTDEEVEGFVEGGAIGRSRPEGLGVDMYNAQQHPQEPGRVGRLDHAQHLPPIGSGELSRQSSAEEVGGWV